MIGNFNLNEPDSLSYAKGMEDAATRKNKAHSKIMNKYADSKTGSISRDDIRGTTSASYNLIFKDVKDFHIRFYYYHLGSQSKFYFVIDFFDGSRDMFDYETPYWIKQEGLHKILDKNKYYVDICCDYMVKHLLEKLEKASIDKLIKTYGIRYFKKLLKASGATNKYFNEYQIKKLESK